MGVSRNGTAVWRGRAEEAEVGSCWRHLGPGHPTLSTSGDSLAFGSGASDWPSRRLILGRAMARAAGEITLLEWSHAGRRLCRDK